MKILFLTKYDRLGASSRLRSIQFLPYLRDLGYAVQQKPLFSDEYVGLLYKNEAKSYLIVKSYFNRIVSLLSLRKYDLIFIEKELFPYIPPFFEFMLKICGVKYVVDYDDPIFHNYDLHPNAVVRRLLGRKIDSVMRFSKHVFAGNSYLQERAISAGANSTSLLPTVIDLARYNLDVQYPTDEFILGWIGSPSTIRYLESLFPVFERIHQMYPSFRVHVIGAKRAFSEDRFFRYIPWKEDSEVQEINRFSVGVMPLFETPFEKGKCAYKLIQYMACSKACICSPVGMNNDVIREGIEGFFAKDANDWEKHITFLIDNFKELERMGHNGRVRVEEIFNVGANVEIMKRTFKALVDGK